MKEKVQRGYFGKREETAVVKFLTSDSEREKNDLFLRIIDPAFIKLIDGVLQMPKFQKIIGITREELAENIYHHIVTNMEKFDWTKTGKDGKPVKAYSYFGTAAKNLALYTKIQNDKIIAQRGGSLDVDNFSNIIEDKILGEVIFKEKKDDTIAKLRQFSLSNNCSKGDLMVCNCLVYMLSNWDMLEFNSKNEFIRLLTYYTGFKVNVITSSLKKIRSYVKIKDNG
jgi:hypothetical protein